MVIRGARVCRDGRFDTDDIVIRNGRFAEPSSDPEGETVDAEGLTAIPGLVDIHFHGCAGYDLCDGTPEALRAILRYQRRSGVLAVCPASMTYEEPELTRVLRNAARFLGGEEEGADLVGIHLEGPFLNPRRAGAQNPDWVRRPDAELFRRLQKSAGGLIRICDIAPETEGAFACIEAIRDEVRVISLAHTETDYDTALRAFAAGARHLTHGYNAMPGIHHREPGPVIAAAEAGAEIELICDGIHVHPAVVRATFRLFGEDRVILVSDSMRACGLADGQYTLGGQDVTVRGRRAELTGHPETIAGSVTDLMGCLRRAVTEMGVPLESAVRAASHNPARSIGIDGDYGDIAPGKFGNVILLNERLEPVRIFQKGRPVEIGGRG